MKQLAGVILLIAGAALILVDAALIAMEVFNILENGFTVTDAKMMIVFILFLLVMIVLIVFAVRLIKSTLNEGQWEMPEHFKLEDQPSFAQQELARERTAGTENEYVPAKGLYIWKYCAEKLSEKHRKWEILGAVIALVLLMLLFCAGLVLLKDTLAGLVGGQQAGLWVTALLLIVMTGVVAAMARYIGQRANSQQIAFARDDAGRMYYFNYHSRILRRFDPENLVEWVMSGSSVYPYGNEIVFVKNIERKLSYCRIYCTLRTENGSDHHTSIELVKNFKYLDELLFNLERLR